MTVPMRLRIDERDCTPISDIPTSELRELYEGMEANIKRMVRELVEMEDELSKRGRAVRRQLDLPFGGR